MREKKHYWDYKYKNRQVEMVMMIKTTMMTVRMRTMMIRKG